jgi:hypothetical protein
MSDIEEEVVSKYEPEIEQQWQAFQALPPVVAESDEVVRDAVIKDLSYASEMNVGEYTLFQKWQEIHLRYPTREVSTLFGNQTMMVDREQEELIKSVQSNIWIPEHVDDYLKLEPVLVYTKEVGLSETWNCIRTFTSTMKNNSNIGRNLNYIVMDKKSGKYLGVICISGDFLDLTPRDKYIGWDRKEKTSGMINHTAIGSTIVPLQPLGFNYVGGKLLALMCLTDEVQYQWEKQYKDKLVGVTTTSLYGKTKAGGLSQYDNLKHWKKMGYSSGSVSYECTKPTVKMLRDWIAANYPQKYFEWYVAKRPDSGQPYKRDHKNRSYNFAYSKLNIPKELIRTEHQRGIYFSPLYTNTNEYLCGKIKEDQLVKAFDTSYEYIANLWKEKYAAKRIKSLTEQNRVTDETLFYADQIYMTWEETKEKYMSQVGR